MNGLDEDKIEVFDGAVFIPVIPGAGERGQLRAVCLPDGEIYIQRLDYDPYEDGEDEYVWRAVDGMPSDEMRREIRKAVQNYVH